MSNQDEEALAELYQKLDTLTQQLLPQDADAECNALLFISSWGQAASFKRDLRFMYAAWAESMGATVRVVEPPQFFYRAEDTDFYLELEGANTFGWLREESGTHCLFMPGVSKPLFARVEVWPSNEARDHEAMQSPNIQTSIENARPPRPRRRVTAQSTDWRTPSNFSFEEDRPGSAELRARRWVQAELSAGTREQRDEQRLIKRRTYSLQEDRLFVRDHLTGLEDGDPSAVLQGRLAPFLRAARLRHLAPLRDVYMIG